MKAIFIILLYLLIINCISFISMGIDKWKARHHAWRIPEATLFLLALLGGALGGTIGMHMFHHKTKHLYFLFGFPIIFALETIIAVYLIASGTISFL